MNVIRMEIKQQVTRTVEQIIFDHWKEVLGYRRARLDQKRLKCIKDRLRDGYTLEDITDAINGCYLSPFHQGHNDRGNRYDDISLICRDAEHIDRFIQIYEDMNQRMEARSQRQQEKAPQSVVSGEKARERLEKMKREVGLR